MKFTPGPWRVRTGTFGDVVDANNAAVAIAQVRNDDAGNYVNGSGQPVRQANARLIAAAPELYEALEVILEEPHGCPFCDSGILRTPNNPAKSHTENCGYYRARLALAKARGEQP